MELRPHRPFHLAFAVRDLDSTRRFYGDLLGCVEGRSAETWIDFDFFGNQISAHVAAAPAAPQAFGHVDGIEVPIPHIGCVLAWNEFHALAQRLVDAGITFLIPPTVRYVGRPGEQATMFFHDPSANALEFKSLRDPEMLFAH